MKIDWSSEKSHVILNPRLPEKEQKLIKSVAIPDLPGHIWLLTSGSEKNLFLKLVGLSKRAFLVSAESVNKHLSSNSKDVWLKCLPDYHVGGLSIKARTHLSGAGLVDTSLKPWCPKRLVQNISENTVSLLSLVPTQVVDLVKNKLVAPKSLRAVVVGGGALPSSVFREAIELGWPLLISYGLTECASQVATRSTNDKKSEWTPVLPHVEVRLNEEGLLLLKSEALLTCYLKIKNDGSHEVDDPKVDGWFTTSDKALLQDRGLKDNGLKILGRASEEVKSLGELVSLAKLREQLQSLSGPEVSTVLAAPDERKGSALYGVFEDFSLSLARKRVAEFNQQVAPYERLSGFYLVRELPKTDLGKVKHPELSNHLRIFSE